MNRSGAFTRLSLGSLTVTATLVMGEPTHNLVPSIIIGLLVGMVGLIAQLLIPISSPLGSGLLWLTVTGLVIEVGASQGMVISLKALVMASVFNAVLQAWLPADVSQILSR